MREIEEYYAGYVFWKRIAIIFIVMLIIGLIFFVYFFNVRGEAGNDKENQIGVLNGYDSYYSNGDGVYYCYNGEKLSTAPG
jgi:hypothetical protein